jgi:hypothetical protein
LKVQPEQDKQMTTVENKEHATELTTEEWLAIRKEAGLRIDPATAEITWCWGQVMDPYGVENLPKECWQVGRNRFARSPGGGVWVSFHDLPEATVAALLKKADTMDDDDLPF